MLKIGKKGELRLVRKDGTSARYGIRIKDSAIMFYDQLRREWHEYALGDHIPLSNGKIARIHIEYE